MPANILTLKKGFTEKGKWTFTLRCENKTCKVDKFEITLRNVRYGGSGMDDSPAGNGYYVVCPNCREQYDIDEADLPAEYLSRSRRR